VASLSAVILAAGEGKRMQSSRTKVMHEILYKPMICWGMDAAREAGIRDLCIVAGKNKSELAAVLREAEVVIQEEQKGTAHALMQAKDFIAARGGDVLVFYGDTPMITPKTLLGLAEAHKTSGADMTALGVRAKDPAGYGRMIINGQNELEKIVEHRDATPEELAVNIINGGFYCFKAEILLSIFPMFDNNNAQNEYYLTDAVAHMRKRGGKVHALICEDEREVLGVNDRVQLAEASAILRARVNERLMRSGVTIIDPASAFISPDAAIGPDTVIEPNVIIKGHSQIGASCHIGPNVSIEECSIGEGSAVNASQLNWSIIGKNANIGPFAYIRPGCKLADNVKIGDFVELKKAEIGEGTKVPHLTYAGDTIIGSHVNIGCGSITVNYDGFDKHLTEIGDNAFIGCNTNLVAPVKVGNGAFTAAGSTITEDIPDDALSIARTRQENKPGWAARHRALHRK